MTTPNITVRFSGQTNLSIEDVWPAGDAPEVVDTAAVRDFMERAGGNKTGMLLEFDLTPYVSIEVEVTDPNQGVLALGQEEVIPISAFRVEKQSYSRGAWRVLDERGQVFREEVFDHPFLGEMSIRGPVCFDRKRDALAWIAEQKEEAVPSDVG